ncbi:PQQ-binding-like beta-propeller repeat protein [Rhizocola hellebori]|uniref:PQQ-binding-like beta-propeller repeat protein n=1 Tax=Rhizocola hellebori TaxID=1392758 RepID=UPI0019442EAD|nr:PQQ-binding-like beta-propeller repeat protein [Rhizocola hellebori]
MGDGFIELGRYDEPTEHVGSRHTLLKGRIARPWIAAGLVVVSLFTLGPAGAKPLPAVQLVADIKLHVEGEMVVVGGGLFVSEPGVLTALDSRTARARWRVQTGLHSQLVRGDGDLLIVTGRTVAIAAEGSRAMSLAIHMGTGEVLWRLPGDLIVAGGFVISREFGFASPAPTSHLTVHDLAARPVWSVELAARLVHTVDQLRQVVLTLDAASGELVEYRLDNGRVVDRTVQPELVGAVGLGAFGQEVLAFFSDGHSLVRGASGFVSELGVFSAAETEQVDCGLLWCAFSHSASGIELVDKSNGEVVYRNEGWIMAVHTDFGVVGIDLFFGGPITIGFFDPLTRRQQHLSGWSPVGLRTDSRVVRWHGPLYLVSSANSRTFFAVLEDARIHVAGSVPYKNLLQCVATSYLIACRAESTMVKAWHLM